VKEVKPLERGGNVKTITMAFKEHMMYEGKKSEKAETNQEHLDLKEKGYGHKKPSGFKLREVNSPMKCWKTHKKVGTKPSPTRPGVTVNDCVKK